MVSESSKKCENWLKRDVDCERKSVKVIYLEGKIFSLPARSMTHFLPADRRIDGDKEGRRNGQNLGGGGGEPSAGVTMLEGEEGKRDRSDEG